MNLAQLLAASTPLPDKAAAYAEDTYVQETVDHLGEAGLDAAEFSRRYSLLLLKPDAIVARAVEPTLQWLRDNDFRVVAAHICAVDRHLVRALWYFAWNIASPERRRLADLLTEISDALVLVVSGEPEALPTSVRLTAAKGPTDPGKRQPGELRYVLGRYSYLLNLVHSPDDPADVLREFAIYFDTDARARVLREIATGEERGAEAAACAVKLYSRTPARVFTRSAATARLLADLGDVPADFDPDRDEDCALLLRRAWATGRAIDPWSAIVLGSQVLPMRNGGRRQTLPPVSAHDWLEARP
ncbi:MULTISPECIES: nucleoside-diphosphate kinase [Nocardia]|uniref:Nucleoside-diphosphate kinase n=1 Tax=Nocardia nova TaxID=37330 RepID=A0A2T2YXL3_9NOCA|nr:MULTISPECIES: nucleoside-diphosphate kinase [Nocardia]MBF6243507.1 nucleoside-diphosphate kinase [Nocardia elegans]PSR60256.1 nucleoside-diphosphate kinase [Nocardia nova]